MSATAPLSRRAGSAVLLGAGLLFGLLLALVGLLALGKWAPASAGGVTDANITSCGASGSTLTFTLGDQATTISYTAGGDVAYTESGTGGSSGTCAPSTTPLTSVTVIEPSSVTLTNPSINVSEQGAAAWPCTAGLVAINAAVPLDVLGADVSGANIVEGAHGINPDVSACSNTEVISPGTATTSTDLVGGTQQAILSAAGGGSTNNNGTADTPSTAAVTLDGTANTATDVRDVDDFLPGDGNDTLIPGAKGSNLQFGNVTCGSGCSIVANFGASSTSTTPAVASDTAELLSGTTVNATYTFDNAGDFTILNGNTSIPTYFYLDGSTGRPSTTYSWTDGTIEAGSGNYSLADSDNTPMGETVVAGSGAQAFTITGVDFTFDGGNGNETIAASGSGNTFDFSNAGADTFTITTSTSEKVIAGAGTQSFTVSASNSTFESGTGSDTFEVTGSTNTFDAAAGPDAFYDAGTGNTVNFSQVGASQTEPLVINDSGTNETIGGTSFASGQAGLVTSSTPTYYTFRDSPSSLTSADFTVLDGASSGYTQFLAGGSGGITLSGLGSSNSASFFGTTGIVVDLQGLLRVTTNLEAGPGDPVSSFQIASGQILVAAPNGAASCIGNSLCDSVSDLYTVTGPTGGYSTFYAGSQANGYNFTDNGSNNNFFGGTGTATFSSSGNENTFIAGTGSLIVNESTTSEQPDNTIDFSGVFGSSGSCSSCTLVVNVSGKQTSVSNYDAAVFNSSGTATSTYGFASNGNGADFTAFIGASSGNTTFEGGSGNYTYTGQGLGNTLDFSEVPSNVATQLVFNVTPSTPIAELGTVPEAFSGITNLVGLSSGNTDFIGGSTGGYTFNGKGTGNQADFTAQGQSTTLTVAVQSGGGNATSGSVTFSLAGGQTLCSNVPVSGGTATCYANGLSSGTNQVVAVYTPLTGSGATGSATVLNSSTGAGSITVGVPGAAYEDQVLTFTATVPGGTSGPAGSGTVLFSIAGGGQVCSTSTISQTSGNNEIFSCSTSSSGLNAGNYDIVATFTPTASGATGAVGVQALDVAQLAATSVSSVTLTQDPFYSSYTLEATVDANGGSGTVTFTYGPGAGQSCDAGTVTGSQTVNCVLGYGTITGGQPILVTFTPTSPQTAGSEGTVSTSSCTDDELGFSIACSFEQSVITTSVAFTTEPTSISAGGSLTLAVQVDNGAPPAGTVTFSLPGLVLCSGVQLDATGTATCLTSNLPPGQNLQVLATFTPDDPADGLSYALSTEFSVAVPTQTCTSVGANCQQTATSPPQDIASGVWVNLSSSNYVAEIENGLVTPTSVTVGTDMVLVAEPASGSSGNCGTSSAVAGYCDYLSDITNVDGSSEGSNVFVAGSSSETFGDTGITGNDTIDFSHVATGSTSSQLVINVSGGSGSYAATVASGGPTYTFTTGGTDFTNFIGSTQGYTEFLASGTPGYSFSASNTNNSIDFSAAGTGVVVNDSASAQTATAVLSGQTYTYSIGSGDVLLSDMASNTTCAPGTANAECDSITGLTTVTGSRQGGTTFYGGAAGGSTYTFTGNGSGNYFYAGPDADSFVYTSSGNTVDFSLLTSNDVAVNISGQLISPTANDTATSGNTTYTFGSGSGVPTTTFVGSPCGTIFYAGTGADNFDGTAATNCISGSPTESNELDFSKSTGGTTLYFCLVAGTGCSSAGFAEMGTTLDGFNSLISVFDGLAGGDTTFVAGSTGGFTFNATGLNDAADFGAVKNTTSGPPGSVGITANLSNFAYGSGGAVASDQVLVAGSSCTTAADCDDLAGITTIYGSTGYANTFVAGSSAESFGDRGNHTGDTIDFTHVSTGSSASLLTVDVSGDANNDTAIVASGGPTYTFTVGGSDFTNFVGSAQGYTKYEASSSPGYNFSASLFGDSIDLSATPAGTIVNLSGANQTPVSNFVLSNGQILVGSITPPGTPSTCASLAVCDTISGLTTVTGSTLGDTTFYGGPTGTTYTFTGNGSGNTFYAGPGSDVFNYTTSGNTVNFSLLANSVTVNVSGQLISPYANDSAGSNGATYTFGSSPTTFVGSPCGTFFYAGNTVEDFDALTIASSGCNSPLPANVLSFADVAQAPSSLTVCVVDGADCNGSDQVQVGAATDQFSSAITVFDGLAGGNTTFDAGTTGGYQFVGFSTNNAIDYGGTIGNVPTTANPIVANLSTAKYTPTTGPAAGSTVGAGFVMVGGLGGTCTSLTSTCDQISNITTVTGSNVGGNVFVAGAGGDTFADLGSAGGDAIDFGIINTSSSSPLLINVSGLTTLNGNNGVDNDTAATGGSNPVTWSFQSGGANFTVFMGSGHGNTHFVAAGDTGGYTFLGVKGEPGNTFDLSANLSQVTANLSPNPVASEFGAFPLASGQIEVSDATSCGTSLANFDGCVDTVANLTNLTGSESAANVFYGGLTNVTFTGTSNDNTLSYAGLASTTNLTIDLVHDKVSGSTGTPDTFSFSPGTLVIQGSPGNVDFLIGSSDVTLEGGGGNDTIDLSSLTSGAEVNLPAGVISNSSIDDTFTLGCGSLTDLCVTAIMGSAGSDTYTIASGYETGGLNGLMITGGTNGGDTLDLSQLPSAVTVTMPVTTSLSGQSIANGKVMDGSTTVVTFTGIGNVDGTLVGGDTFYAGTGTETFSELTGDPGILNFQHLPRSMTSTNGISVTVTTVGGAGQGTATSTPLNANDTFTGIDTFYGTVGNDTFVQDSDPIYTFYGDGGDDTLNLTGATSGIAVAFTPDNSCSAGANSGTASVNGETDTFHCISTVLTSGTIGFSVAPGQTATLSGGGTGDLILNCTLVADPCNGQGVTITLPNGSAVGTVEGDGFSFSFTGMSIVNGTPFNDLFIAGSQNVTIKGDGGSDGVNFAGAPNAIVVNLSGNSYTVPTGYGVAAGTVVPGMTAVGGYGGTITLNGISNVIGTSNLNDIFIGGSTPGVLQGGSGTDRYVLTGGDTSIIAGNGSNTLDLTELSGFTTVTLDDNLPQNTGDGVLTLVSGNIQTAIASPAGSSLEAGDVNGATLIGGPGTDKLYAGSGSNQTLIGGGGKDVLEGGTGNDTLEGGSQPVIFVPGEGDDTITSTGTDNTLSYAGATGGVDINLTSNNYSVPPGEPYAGTTLAADTAIGGYGGSVTVNGAGIVNVTGSPGNDILVAGNGDTINGDGGNDLFVIDGGNNTLTAGGTGSSTFLWEAAGSNTVNGNGSSTVDFSQASAGVTVNLQANSATGGFGGNQKLTGILNIIGTNYNDVLIAGSAHATLTGLNGNDFLQASQYGDDTLEGGGNGSDTFCAESGQVAGYSCAKAGTGAAGGDTMSGGSGTNYFFAKNGEVDTITGGPGINYLVDDPNDDITNPSAFTGM